MTQHSVIIDEIHNELEDFLSFLRTKITYRYPDCSKEDVENIIDYALEQASEWEWD